MERPYETNGDPRFYSIPDHGEPTDDVGGWTAVVDEERGGIVAYFGDEDQATAFVALLNTFPLIHELEAS